MSDHEEESNEETAKRRDELRRQLQMWFDRHQEANRAYQTEELRLRRKIEFYKHKTLHKKKLLEEIRQIMSNSPTETHSSHDSSKSESTLLKRVTLENTPVASKQRSKPEMPGTSSQIQTIAIPGTSRQSVVRLSTSI